MKNRHERATPKSGWLQRLVRPDSMTGRLKMSEWSRIVHLHDEDEQNNGRDVSMFDRGYGGSGNVEELAQQVAECLSVFRPPYLKRIFLGPGEMATRKAFLYEKIGATLRLIVFLWSHERSNEN